MGYFQLADTPRVLGDLDEWFRRRMRQIRWKEWEIPKAEQSRPDRYGGPDDDSLILPAAGGAARQRRPTGGDPSTVRALALFPHPPPSPSRLTMPGLTHGTPPQVSGAGRKAPPAIVQEGTGQLPKQTNSVEILSGIHSEGFHLGSQELREDLSRRGRQGTPLKPAP